MSWTSLIAWSRQQQQKKCLDINHYNVQSNKVNKKILLINQQRKLVLKQIIYYEEHTHKILHYIPFISFDSFKLFDSNKLFDYLFQFYIFILSDAIRFQCHVQAFVYYIHLKCHKYLFCCFDKKKTLTI